MAFDITEASDQERLCIAQALYSYLAAEVSTKDPHNLRGRVNDAFHGMYQVCGAKSFDLMLNGKKVGTYSLSVTKPVHVTRLEVTDRPAFERWALENGYAREERRIVIDDEDVVLASLVTDGVVPDGCEWREIDEPEHVKPSGTIRGCKPEQIAEALGSGLTGAVTGLLMGATTEGE